MTAERAREILRRHYRRLRKRKGCPSCGAHRPQDNATTCATCCEELARVEQER